MTENKDQKIKMPTTSVLTMYLYKLTGLIIGVLVFWFLFGDYYISLITSGNAG